MEKEVTILCLVYIERLLIKSGFGLDTLNWRKITFTALVSFQIDSRFWPQRYGTMNPSRMIISLERSHLTVLKK